MLLSNNELINLIVSGPISKIKSSSSTSVNVLTVWLSSSFLPTETSVGIKTLHLFFFAKSSISSTIRLQLFSLSDFPILWPLYSKNF